MKMLWCWRCKVDVPMLDDEEFRRVMSLRGTGTFGGIRERQFGQSSGNTRESQDIEKRAQVPFITTVCRYTVRHARLAENH